jgi:hypothetical protein
LHHCCIEAKGGFRQSDELENKSPEHFVVKIQATEVFSRWIISDKRDQL